MSLGVVSILDRVVSHAMASGWFERVNRHEPKNAPGHGLTCSIWSQRIEVARRNSGLTAASAHVIFFVRIFRNMLAEPQDDIDPNVMQATDALFTAYIGDFTLDDLVMSVDILGQEGVPLSAEMGYVDIDKAKYRCMTITLPLIVNDVWTEAP